MIRIFYTAFIGLTVMDMEGQLSLPALTCPPSIEQWCAVHIRQSRVITYVPIFTSVEAKARPLQPMPGLSSPPVGSFIRTLAMAARAGSIGSSPTNVT